MLTGLIFLAVVSGVVCVIEWNSNKNYYGVVRLHEIHLERQYNVALDGVSTMEYSDIVDVLCNAKVCVELNNEIYFNSITLQKGYGNRSINRLDAVKVLAYQFVGG